MEKGLISLPLIILYTVKAVKSLQHYLINIKKEKNSKQRLLSRDPYYSLASSDLRLSVQGFHLIPHL